MKKIQIALILGILLMITACSSKKQADLQIIGTQSGSATDSNDLTSIENLESSEITPESFKLSTQSDAYYLSPTDRETIEKNSKQLKDIPKIIKPWIMRGAKPYLLLGDPKAANGYAIRYLSSKNYDETIAFLQKNIVKESLEDASLVSEVSGAGLATWSYAGFLSDGNILHLLISYQENEDVNVYIIVDPPQS